MAVELERHYAQSAYRHDDNHVFAHPTKGSRLCCEWFRLEFAEAQKAAGVEGRVRIHDLRHAALTNMAAAGASPMAIMGTAGHRSIQTTRQYVHLAGVTFPDDAAALADRLLGVPSSGTKQPESAQLSGSR